MWENVSVGKSKAFIRSHFGLKEQETPGPFVRPAITISRQEGAGGLTVASNLADYLKTYTASHEEWTVFSQHLVAKVLEEFNHEKGVADFMKEGHKGFIRDAIEELLGLHPSAWTLVEQANATILHLAQVGNVILVGRGSNIVTRKLQTAFHVHLVGSLEKRVKRAEKTFGLDPKEAANYVKKKDEARRRYIKDNFDKEINDPLLYHVVVNTDLVSYEEAARLIGNEVIARFKLDIPVKKAVSTSRSG